MTLEVLAGDFKGNTEHVDIVLDADPDVFAHNLETVPRLSRQVRVQASYPRSYKILEHARKRAARSPRPGSCSASARRSTSCAPCSRELASSASTSSRSASTCGRRRSTCPWRATRRRTSSPALKDEALAMGFPHVESGPMVRSSYHADGQRDIVLALRNRA